MLYAGVAGLALWGVVEAGLHITANDDLWWNLATGRHILRHLEIPRVDVFSHTFAGQPWVNLEWLSHLTFFAVYDLLGESAVVYLRLALIAAIFGVALVHCRVRSRSWALACFAVAFGAWVCRPFLDARAQLFTFLWAAVVLLVLELYRRHDRDLLWLLPPILLVWTQQHGGYVLGLLLLAGTVAAEAGKRLLRLPADPLSWRRIGRLAAFAAAAAAAVAINPWTLEAYTHPLAMSELVGGPNVYLAMTQEWLPPRFLAAAPFSPLAFWPLLGLVALVSLPVAAVRWRAFDFNDVGLAAVLALAFALRHRRFIPLFAILTLPLLAWGLRFWTDWWAHGRRRPDWTPGSPLPLEAGRRLARAGALAAVGCWLLVALVAPARARGLAARYRGQTLFAASNHLPFYPREAVGFVRGSGLSGPMFNLYHWGGYLEMFLPEHPTYIDGRAQMVFPEAFYRGYLAAHWGYPGWRRVLDRHGIGFALIHTSTNAVLFRAMERDPEWRWIFGHGASALLLREAPENREVLERFDARRLPHPETALTAFIYGRHEERQGDLERAIEDYRRAVERAPGHAEAGAALIGALAAAGRGDEAREAARRALDGHPESPPVLLAVARLESAERPEEAFRRFRRVFERWPDQVEAVDGMLDLDPERGARVLEALHSGIPRRAWASYAMGRLAERRGDLEAARAHYEDEGRAGGAAGDQARLLWAREALSRLEAAASEPPAGEAPADGEAPS